MKIGHGNAASFQHYVDQEWSSNPCWPFKAGFDFFCYNPFQSCEKGSIGWKHQLLVRPDGSLIRSSGPVWGFAFVIYTELCKDCPAFETSDIVAEYAAFIERLLEALEITHGRHPFFNSSIEIARDSNCIGALMLVHDYVTPLNSVLQFKPYDYAIGVLIQINEYVSALPSSENPPTILSDIARTFTAAFSHSSPVDRLRDVLATRGLKAGKGSKIGGDALVYDTCDVKCRKAYFSMLLIAHANGDKLPTQKEGAEHIYKHMKADPAAFNVPLNTSKNQKGKYRFPPFRTVNLEWLRGTLDLFKSEIINIPDIWED